MRDLLIEDIWVELTNKTIANMNAILSKQHTITELYSSMLSNDMTSSWWAIVVILGSRALRAVSWLLRPGIYATGPCQSGPRSPKDVHYKSWPYKFRSDSQLLCSSKAALSVTAHIPGRAFQGCAALGNRGCWQGEDNPIWFGSIVLRQH